MSSTEIVKTIEAKSHHNIIVDNIIDGDKTDNNIIDNNKTNVDDNDCIEMTLSPKEVRKMLREFGFDNKEVELWSEPIEIPLGVSMTPFVIREVILSGLHFQDIEEYPEISYECKKGNQHFLYRGIRTSDTIPVFLLRIALVSSVNNEFGPGLYCTPNLILLLSMQEKMAQFLYMIGEWEDTVKGWICIDDDSKPGPPQFDEDII
ncbi:unnamed protein product [Rhizophagus irregularis]|nr:unnamed protein product [Rhizophagus irregularis]